MLPRNLESGVTEECDLLINDQMSAILRAYSWCNQMRSHTINFCDSINRNIYISPLNTLNELLAAVTLGSPPELFLDMEIGDIPLAK